MNGVLVCLEVGPDVPRLNAIGSRKCRAASALVIGCYSSTGDMVPEARTVPANGQPLIYRTGEVVVPDRFDDDIRVECSHGIHFFITKAEAEAYAG